MKHLVLLGDSIFDNQAYVKGGLDVISHLRQLMLDGWKATLLAVDGNVVEDVPQQIRALPDDATHLIVSAGGNNALMNAEILQIQVASSAEVFSRLADVATTFEFHYRKMLEMVLRLKKPTTVCTIYYPQIPDALARKIAVAALASFNDVIVKQAFLAGVPLIDLRLVCNDPAHYANEIEPSEAGGKKIAETILRVVNDHNFEIGKTTVFH